MKKIDTLKLKDEIGYLTTPLGKIAIEHVKNNIFNDFNIRAGHMTYSASLLIPECKILVKCTNGNSINIEYLFDIDSDLFDQ